MEFIEIMMKNLTEFFEKFRYIIILLILASPAIYALVIFPSAFLCGLFKNLKQYFKSL